MITNNEAIRFSNEQVRVYSEKMRNMYWEFKALAVYWQNTISSIVPNDPAEILTDGREDATEITGEDIHNFVTNANNFIQAMEETEVLAETQKPCVRTFRSN